MDNDSISAHMGRAAADSALNGKAARGLRPGHRLGSHRQAAVCIRGIAAPEPQDFHGALPRPRTAVELKPDDASAVCLSRRGHSRPALNGATARRLLTAQFSRRPNRPAAFAPARSWSKKLSKRPENDASTAIKLDPGSILPGAFGPKIKSQLSRDGAAGRR